MIENDKLKQEIETVALIWRSNHNTIKQLQDKLNLLTLSPNETLFKYKELLIENKVLNDLIKQHEQTLESIMKKFRQQTLIIQQEKKEIRNQLKNDLEKEKSENSLLRNENMELTIKLQELTELLRNTLNDDLNESEFYKLQTENETLKCLLKY
jgi:hypothetical protein